MSGGAVEIPYHLVLDHASALTFVWIPRTGKAGAYDAESGDLISEVAEGETVRASTFWYEAAPGCLVPISAP